MTDLRERTYTRAEYDELVLTGVFEGEHIELIRGRVVEMSPQGQPHFWVIAKLNMLLARGVDPDRYEVGPQGPLAVGDHSEPEPDIAISAPRTLVSHATTAYVVIEVALSSQAYDLGVKAELYAEAGVDRYLVFDLPHRCVHDHREPSDGAYTTVEQHRPGDDLSVLDVPLDLHYLLPQL